MWYGIGNTGAKNPSTAQIELNLDGRPTIFTGAADLGQGSTLVLAQLASEILGLRPEDFEIVAADTGRTTNAGATSASRQTYISGNAVCQAASALTDALKGCVSDLWQSSPEDIEIAEGMIKSKSRSVSMSLAQGAQLLVKKGQKLKYDGFFDPDSTALDDLGQGRPYGAYAFACQMAEIEVDALTGQVEVQRLVAAHDVGRAVSPSNIIGQICGGAAMGVGLALTEEFVDDDTESFKDYHLILASDMPKVEALIVECSEPTGPFGAKGIGEPALVPTAPAVVNALSMALGKRIIRLPASLEQVMKASLQAGWPNRVEELLRNWVNKPVES
jgi:CO/xanthine dehydrogenase Mo-binding subunit